MMCKYPYIKLQSGVTVKQASADREARVASTPFPCGQCLNCRINKRRMWLARIMIEGLATKPAAFITLTYDDDNLPPGENLHRKDFVDFMKLLRYHLSKSDRKLRYFAVGEYGDAPEHGHRPHYHCVAFGLCMVEKGIIDKCWDKGITHIGEVNHKSARYIAGYATKVKTKEREEKIISGRSAEFLTSSRKPGIGAPGIDLIAEKCKKSGFWPKNKVLTEVPIGRRMYPLGRYLSNRFACAMDIDKEVMWRRYEDYHNEMLDKHQGKGKLFIKSVIDENEGKRIRQERVFKIFKGIGRSI